MLARLRNGKDIFMTWKLWKELFGGPVISDISVSIKPFEIAVVQAP
jgi:hypothetical protein